MISDKKKEETPQSKRHTDMVRNNKQGRLGWMGKQEPQRRAVSVLPGHTVALTVTVRSQSTELNIGKLNRGYDVAIKSLLQV